MEQYDVNQFEELSDQELLMLIENDDEMSDVYYQVFTSRCDLLLN